MKRLLCLLCCFILLSPILTGCSSKEAPKQTADATYEYACNQGYSIQAAVLYCGKDNSDLWKDTFQYLSQSLMLNLDVTAMDVCDAFSLSDYDVLYLDHSIVDAQNAPAVMDAIIDYTAAGGAVFLTNDFYDFFPADYIGAKSFAKISTCPTALSCPEVGDDLTELQEIISDFASLYPSFSDFEAFSAQDYGYGMVPDTAVSFINWEGYALYTMNMYGKGHVFFTNPLLPNMFSLSNFSMEYRSDEQAAFSSTTASCNQLLLNGFAAYVSKQTYGYALNRVFGYYGSPSMSWELHYEEITGIKNNSMAIFSGLCKEYQQIPSFVLIRNSYWWFLRAESLSYLLNKNHNGGQQFDMDYHESAYSSGTHVDSAGTWLSLSSIKDAGSYFLDYPDEYNYRSYPCLLDYNHDGMQDILCGSADGQIYYYVGKGFNGRLCVSEAQKLTNMSGAPLSVDGYSAPQWADINGDGYLDLISGSADGNIYWFSGNGTLSFAPQGILIHTNTGGQALPTCGDVNGDGVSDLMVGSDRGVLLLYYGTADRSGAIQYSQSHMRSYSKLCANKELGDWLAPTLTDLNHDGVSDLAVGTFDGYVALFDAVEKGEFVFDHYVSTEEMNYKGNNNLKFGNYCVPVFCDLNGDGAEDLLCGSLEYGLAYPIDSKYFPYAEQLAQQAAYANENHYYVGVHFYTNAYASEEREAYELQAHLKAMEHYGLPVEDIGTNQHTWYTSTHSAAQSLLSAFKAGLLWNSGFGSSGASWNSPQTAAENVIAMPFFLTEDGNKTILVQNNSILPYCGTEWQDISGKYGMPMCIYYHCDFVYESDTGARDYLQKTSDFQRKFGYNFNSEDQLMRASAAAYNLRVDVNGGIADHSTALSITPSAIADNFPLYKDNVQRSVGLEIAFSETMDADLLTTDADVWYRNGNSLFIGLNKPAKIYCKNSDSLDISHLEKVNMSAEIQTTPDGAQINFLDDGMMQAVVSGNAVTDCQGWTVRSQDEKTVFTKYGAGENLQITYLEGA